MLKTNNLAIISLLVAIIGILYENWGKEHIIHEIFDSLIHEVVFAIFVSLIMWALFELSKASDEEQKWKVRIKLIGESVFYALFGKSFKKNYINEVMKNSLESKFYRDQFYITYTIKDKEIDSKNKNGKLNFTILNAEVRFRMTNVSRENSHYPIRILLPNPISDELKQFVHISSIDISQKSHPQPKSCKNDLADQAFIDNMANSSERRVIYNAGEVLIPEGEYIDVVMNYTMVKHIKDSEFIETAYPCDGMTVKIMQNGDCGKKVVEARSVHREQLDTRTPDSCSTEFKICVPLLPHQGILWWWEEPITHREDS